MHSDDELDTVERHIDIDADAERVWGLISRPGWWINDGTILTNPDIESDGDNHLLHDPVHGTFAVRTVLLDPPRRARFRWRSGSSFDVVGSTLVELTISDRPGGVRLSVVESGFAALGEDRAAWLAVREENVAGWAVELDAARSYFDPLRVSRSVHVPALPDRVWPVVASAEGIARWYAFDGAVLEPVVGGRVELYWAEHGRFHGRVRDVVPHERLSFDLALEPDVEPEADGATRVTFELTGHGVGGTVVTVRQDGFDRLGAAHGRPAELADQDRESWEAGLGLLPGALTSDVVRGD